MGFRIAKVLLYKIIRIINIISKITKKNLHCNKIQYCKYIEKKKTESFTKSNIVSCELVLFLCKSSHSNADQTLVVLGLTKAIYIYIHMYIKELSAACVKRMFNFCFSSSFYYIYLYSQFRLPMLRDKRLS